MTRYRALAPCEGRLMAWKVVDGPWLNLVAPVVLRKGAEMTIETMGQKGAIAIFAPDEAVGERVSRLLVRAEKVEKDG